MSRQGPSTPATRTHKRVPLGRLGLGLGEAIVSTVLPGVLPLRARPKPKSSTKTEKGGTGDNYGDPPAISQDPPLIDVQDRRLLLPAAKHSAGGGQNPYSSTLDRSQVERDVPEIPTPNPIARGPLGGRPLVRPFPGGNESYSNTGSGVPAAGSGFNLFPSSHTSYSNIGPGVPVAESGYNLPALHYTSTHPAHRMELPGMLNPNLDPAHSMQLRGMLNPTVNPVPASYHTSTQPARRMDLSEMLNPNEDPVPQENPASALEMSGRLQAAMHNVFGIELHDKVVIDLGLEDPERCWALGPLVFFDPDRIFGLLNEVVRVFLEAWLKEQQLVDTDQINWLMRLPFLKDVNRMVMTYGIGTKRYMFVVHLHPDRDPEIDFPPTQLADQYGEDFNLLYKFMSNKGEKMKAQREIASQSVNRMWIKFREKVNTCCRLSDGDERMAKWNSNMSLFPPSSSIFSFRIEPIQNFTKEFNEDSGNQKPLVPRWYKLHHHDGRILLQVLFTTKDSKFYVRGAPTKGSIVYVMEAQLIWNSQRQVAVVPDGDGVGRFKIGKFPINCPGDQVFDNLADPGWIVAQNIDMHDLFGRTVDSGSHGKSEEPTFKRKKEESSYTGENLPKKARSTAPESANP